MELSEAIGFVLELAKDNALDEDQADSMALKRQYVMQQKAIWITENFVLNNQEWLDEGNFPAPIED